MPLAAGEEKRLLEGARGVGVALSRAQLVVLGRYVDLLLQWRAHARLLSQRQSRSDIIGKHIVDSLAVVRLLSERARVADVGSGAGFPGIPVAVVLPAAELVLIEANRRKANFLREVARQLPLANARVLEARAEDVDEDGFDAVISRAAASVGELLRCARGLVSGDGVVIAMKGPAVKTELDRIDAPQLGFRLSAIETYRLPSGESRSLVVLCRFT
jgi:16S rRNA (guanine527-N7)-methyltransferase